MILRSGGELPDQQWIVESDYLYPYGEGENAGSIAYPLDQPQSTDPRFRYMGQCMLLADWRQNQQNGNMDEYLDKLTAVGYGESSFAAFYPNCVSVFGFWDDEITSEIPPEGLRYSLIGWYRDSSTDFFLTSTSAASGGSVTNTDLLIQLQNDFDWIVPIPIDKTALLAAAPVEAGETDIWTFLTDKGWVAIDPNDEDTGALALPATDFDSELAANFPNTIDNIKQVIDDAISDNLPRQMLCYAQLTFGNVSSVASSTQSGSVELAIGNTGTEALSSYLAYCLAKQLDPDCDNAQVDPKKIIMI